MAIQILVSILVFALLVTAVYFIAYGISHMSSSPAESSVSSQESLPEESVALSSAPQQQQPSLKARQMPVEVASSPSKAQTFIEQAKSDGFSAVVVPMKTKDGEVLYSSSVEQVAAWGAQNALIDADSLIEAIRAEGMTPIAQIYALQDNTAAHAKRKNSYYYGKDTNTTRKFEDGRYLNPYKQAARSYICDIVQELGSMGFEQVLVDGMQFPGVELSSNIGTDANGASKSDILKQFIQELNATGVNTIISYDWAAIGGGSTADLLYGGDPSGYGAQALAPVIDWNSPPENIEAAENELVATAMKAAAEQAPDAPIILEVKSGNSSAQMEQQLHDSEDISYIEITEES